MSPDEPPRPVRALDRAPAGPDGRMFAPSAERNAEELLPVLARVLPEAGRVLEIGSGTGQHAAFFGARFPRLTWLPTDLEAATFASIRAWCAAAGAQNVAAPRVLDVTAMPADAPACEAVVAINVLHIAPEAAVDGLMRIAAHTLPTNGSLSIYGPFLFSDRPNAPSNEEFDERLRTLDPRFGVRRVDDVARAATQAGLSVGDVVPMPHNNTTLVIHRPASSP